MTIHRERCTWCGGDVIPGSTCPRSLTCPRCGAEPGRSCRRPSGHRASQLHAGRIGAAEDIDADVLPAHPVLPSRHETQTALELAGV